MSGPRLGALSNNRWSGGTKNEQNRICRSKAFLQLLCSFFCRTCFDHSKPFGGTGPEFPWGPKLEALTVVVMVLALCRLWLVELLATGVSSRNKGSKVGHLGAAVAPVGPPPGTGPTGRRSGEGSRRGPRRRRPRPRGRPARRRRRGRRRGAHRSGAGGGRRRGGLGGRGVVDEQHALVALVALGPGRARREVVVAVIDADKPEARGRVSFDLRRAGREEGQDVPGLPSRLSPDLLVRALPGSPGQPWRTHLKGDCWPSVPLYSRPPLRWSLSSVNLV